MPIKNAPATPLPWRASADGVVGQRSLLTVAPVVKFGDDRDYIGHAANAYPKLVEALQIMRVLIRGRDLEHVWLNYPTKPEQTPGSMCDELLRSLGEDA